MTFDDSREDQSDRTLLVMENMVETIFNKALNQGRLCADTIPFSWFAKTIEDVYPAGDDIMNFDTLKTKLKDLRGQTAYKRLNRKQVHYFFKTFARPDQPKSRSNSNTSNPSSLVSTSSDVGFVTESDPNPELNPDYQEPAVISAPALSPLRFSREFKKGKRFSSISINEQEEEYQKIASENEILKAEIKRHVANVATTQGKLKDERDRNELLIDELKQVSLENTKNLEQFENQANLLEIEKNEGKTKMEFYLQELDRMQVEKEDVTAEYEQQILDMGAQLAAYEQSNQDLKQNLDDLEQIQKYARMEEEREMRSEECLTPQTELVTAMEKCKKENAIVTRLNKSESDLSWWYGLTSPTPFLQKLRAPIREQGENLADYFPIKAEMETNQEECQILEQKNRILVETAAIWRKKFWTMAITAALLSCVIIWLLAYYFQDELVTAGVFTVERHPLFYTII